MKILNIKNYFYSNEKICSKEQLKMDFGEFPPVPLNCIIDPSKFTITRAKGISTPLIKLALVKKYWDVAESDGKIASHQLLQNSIEMNNMISAVKNMKKSSVDLLKSIGVSNDNTLRKIMKPLQLLMALKFPMPKLKNKRTLGIFLPITNKESQIFIIDRKRKKKIDLKSVISHEHIHLLQYKNNEFENNIKRLEVLISEQKICDKHLLYLLKRFEVEARLHEVVLSYYRFQKELPMKIEEFLGMITGSKSCGPYVALPLLSAGIEVKFPDYSDREPLFCEQLSDIFYALKNDEITISFTTEVLSVMYGNLLRYYGDEKSSHEFLKQIPRPNLYDRLYS